MWGILWDLLGELIGLFRVGPEWEGGGRVRRSGDFNITTEKEAAVTVLGLASLLQGLWVRVPLECLVWPLSTSMFSLSPGLYLP